MFRSHRASVAVTLVVGLLASLPVAGAVARTTPSHAVAVAHVSDLHIETRARHTTASPGACRDGHYTVEGPRWQSKYRWSFRAATTPKHLSRNAAEATIRRAFVNIVKGRNDCGLPDRVNARVGYLGRTSVAPSCKRSDGRNVVGFRSLPDGVAARACWWMIGNRIIEADVQISTNVRWATSVAGCVDQLMLEAVMTHEAGHVFGLGHVGERRHGRLTMSTFVDGPCNNQESTLGLGDVRGLQALYP